MQLQNHGRCVVDPFHSDTPCLDQDAPAWTRKPALSSCMGRVCAQGPAAYVSAYAGMTAKAVAAVAMGRMGASHGGTADFYV